VLVTQGVLTTRDLAQPYAGHVVCRPFAAGRDAAGRDAGRDGSTRAPPQLESRSSPHQTPTQVEQWIDLPSPRAVPGPSDAQRRREPSRTPESVSAAQRPCSSLQPDVEEGGADESVCKPDPVPGRLTASRSATIHLGLPSPAGSCGPPAGSDGPPSNACAAARLTPRGLLTLLRVGFTEPPRSPGVLVVSYTTVSPLPRAGCAGRSVLCGTVPRVAPGCR
jgi:hypothetical protein